MQDCKHCDQGFLDNRYGQDVECVNGVLIDIDAWTEGFDPTLVRPVAPCHPKWSAQIDDPDGDTWENDSCDRLAAALRQSEPPVVSGALKPCRHGHARHGYESPTWVSWQSMRARCKYVDRDTKAKHAGRGISVCDRWQTFDNFLRDMGSRPEGTTLDRFPDNDGNYEPSNCRWATPVEQARNRRNSRLTFETAVEVALAMLNGGSSKQVSAAYGTSESLPREIKAGRCWKDALARAQEIANG